MKFNVIIAVDNKNGIGKNNSLPWHFSEDLVYFKRVTSYSETLFGNNAVIMGRKTCESLPNKYLPRRINIVMTRSVDYKNDSVLIVNNFNDALRVAKENNVDNIWVIGGSEVYQEAFRHYLIDKIYITIIDNDFDCDTKVELPDFKVLKTSKYITIDTISKNKYNIVNIVGKVVETSENLYLNLLNEIITTGEKRDTRNAKTLSLFSKELTFSIEDGFPLLTTKRMFWKGIVEELLFFIRGDTNTKNLEEKGVNIWKGNTSTEFLNQMNLNYDEGMMGPMYGYQWRFYNKPYESQEGGIDQLKELIELIKKDPHSRRLLLTDYNPSQVHEGVLYPCHSLILQFYVKEEKLSVKMYQRSADTFLGLPFNIASTSLLLTIISKLCNLKPGNVTISLGDCHIYESHLEAVKKQLSRTPYYQPKLVIPDFTTLEEVENSKLEDYVISNYNHHMGIKAEMIA